MLSGCVAAVKITSFRIKIKTQQARGKHFQIRGAISDWDGGGGGGKQGKNVRND